MLNVMSDSCYCHGSYLTCLLGVGATTSLGVGVEGEGEGELLDERDSLRYLGLLRHTKWFQAKASVLPSCVLTIRILRDLCQRVAT